MKRLILSVVIFLSIGAAAIGAEGPSYINGRVERIVDGDTLIVREGDSSHRIRLYGVDCPESLRKGYWSAQPFSAEARAFAAKIDGREATVIVHGRGAFGRQIGEVFVAGRSLNRELLRAGLAWWSKSYAPKDHDLRRLEEKARKQKRGLWAQPAPTPPWLHRKAADLRRRPD